MPNNTAIGGSICTRKDSPPVPSSSTTIARTHMQDEYWLPVTDVPALRSCVSQPTDPDRLSQMAPLVQEAEKTKWDRLPLCAIAEAHKKEAERLAARGNLDANPNAYTAICVEYFKYLQLYPYKDSPEYKKVVERVHVLERGLGHTISVIDNSVAVDFAHNASSKWRFFGTFLLGLVVATTVSSWVRI
ncbi:hypothetical protein C8R47DRAFT_128762 [Mycena vitilis]|nr:hypothetical protein C8R47DRAFT_128762 [Mycena vitilis]